MQVKLAKTPEDLARIAPVMSELRPQYTPQALVDQMAHQQTLGYQVAFVEKDDDVLCVAGFVVGEKLAWQKHLYVDDLVTAGKHRSTGAGGIMIAWLKALALELGCQQLHLDSGVQRFAAHKFYLREGFIINSHHFAIPELKGD